MVIKACPDCGNDVSSRAETCPHCGYPLANVPVVPKPPELTKRQKRNQVIWTVIIFVIVLALVVFADAVGLFSLGSSSP